MGDLETGKKLDNSARLPLTGWKLWWRLLLRDGQGIHSYYKDSAFPACPACGSPSVRLVTQRKGQSYLCLELNCRSQGPCEVEGSDGIEARKANVRMYVYLAAFVVLLLVLMLLGGKLPNFRYEIGMCGRDWRVQSPGRDGRTRRPDMDQMPDRPAIDAARHMGDQLPPEP